MIRIIVDVFEFSIRQSNCLYQTFRGVAIQRDLDVLSEQRTTPVDTTSPPPSGKIKARDVAKQLQLPVPH